MSVRDPSAADLPLRIAQVAPVAQAVPPVGAGSVETATALLVDGLVARGHDVTLYATADSRTGGTLQATFRKGYNHDDSLWPWELCELFNLAAAIEHAARFDLIHYQAEYAPISLAFSRLSTVPLVQTLHHMPSRTEVALWSRYASAPFVALSKAQARALDGLNVVATIHHAVDPSAYAFRATPDDYLLFLGRFTAGKGVLEAIHIARHAGMRLVLAAPPNDYFHAIVAPEVDGTRVVYAGEVHHAEKVDLLGRARALIYPVQEAEPFGLVLIEAMACGTPVAALARGAVDEIVEPGVTGQTFRTIEELAARLPEVLALNRARVRERVTNRFGPERLVDAHLDAYRSLLAASSTSPPTAP